MNKRIASLAVMGLLLAQGAYAAPGPVDFSVLTASIDESGVVTAILAVAAITTAVLVVIKGVNWIMGQLGYGGDDYDDGGEADWRMDQEDREYSDRNYAANPEQYRSN